MKIKTLLFVAAIIVAGFLYWHHRNPPASGKNYQTIAVERGRIRKVVLATGIVQPENKLEIKPPINGRAEQVLVAIGDNVKQGQVLAWMSSSERAALLDAARTKGAKELARWEDFYKAAALVAPLDGRIIDKSVVPGQVVTSSESVFTMSDHLVAAANLDETDLAKIRLGQNVELLLDAYPDQPFAGKVERIAYTSTTVNNVTTFEVDILPDRVPDFMRNGMTADLTFVKDEKENALLIPFLAVTKQGDKDTVLIPGAPPQAREVTVGINDGKKVEVLSGLKEGDPVLLEVPDLTSSASGGLLPAPSKGAGPPP